MNAVGGTIGSVSRRGTTALGRRAGARTRRCGEALARAGATPLARCHADQDGFDPEAGVHVRADQRDRLERILADGFKFTVDVIDTWNMTITPLEGVYEIKKKDDYVFVDTEGRSIPLPGKPYMALRIRRVGPIVPVTPPKRDHET